VRAAVVGTGFIGLVHVAALRTIGVEVAGVVGSSPERAGQKPGLPEPYPSYEALLADPSVDVVHIATPNHLHYEQVKAALAAGKHVVCEKPLALTSDKTEELVRLADESGLVNCTNYNVRFYGQCHAARARVQAGDLGRVFDVRGGYIQDWLLKDTDWNWRLDPEQGGELRAIADIGTHWLDLVLFISGKRVSNVLADLATVHPVRRAPAGPVETFAGDGAAVERVERTTASEDLAHVLLRFEDGARGSFSVSQVSAGAKNRLWLELDGTESSLQWDSEAHEQLRLGHRDRPNEVHWREPGPASEHPSGHPEGFPETFQHLYRAVYRAVANGRMPDQDAVDFPTFRDGHEEIVLIEAIAASARAGRWTDVRRPRGSGAHNLSARTA
jgi:predicted dehydrogenase